VVEFSDFECPQCRRASTDFEALRSRFAGQVRFVFKHYPLDTQCNTAVRRSLHKHACAAADAAICAGEQIRLWSFQKEVFARGVEDADLTEAAEAAGLDIASWQQCRWTDAAREAVLLDVEDGIRLGITKTPSFLVGNRLLAGASGQSELPDEILRQLAEAPPK
jgi:protein-disulfide isomerase